VLRCERLSELPGCLQNEGNAVLLNGISQPSGKEEDVLVDLAVEVVEDLLKL
jgi:hypothetical protein